jgi:hypothetical protein
MEPVLETFELSLQVEEQLNDMVAYKCINEADMVVQCIDIGHKIMTEWQANRIFLQEATPLVFPEPRQLAYPTFHQLKIFIYPISRLSFDEICMRFVIDRQSALSWGMECLKIIDEAAVTHTIYTYGVGGRRPFTLRWIHR